MFVGIDPSFTSTGVAVYLPEERRFDIWCVKHRGYLDKTFSGLYPVVTSLTDRIASEIRDRGVPTHVLSESPLPNMSFSAGLSMLDVLLVRELSSTTEYFFTANPNFLSTIHGRRGTKKKDSSDLARDIIEVLSSAGYLFPDGKRFITHDSAEAFLYLIRLLVRYEMIPEVSVLDRIEELSPGLWIEKEVRLLDG